ncbi:ROK family protein [Arthrobacter sp. Z1-15]
MTYIQAPAVAGSAPAGRDGTAGRSVANGRSGITGGGSAGAGAPPVGNPAGDMFQLLRDGHARTRSELAAATGLARSTVAARVDLLLASGLVGPAGEAVSSGGRPPSRVAFNPDAKMVLAVDVGATHIRAAGTNLVGTEFFRSAAAMPVSAGPEAILDWVVAAGRDMLAAAARPEADLAGVGIGLPGPVEHLSGRPVKPPIMPGWDGFDVVDYIQRSLRVPVLVDNDVNIMALGERAAYWPGHDDLLFIKVATGVGAGLISSGQLQRGANGTAGDLGHVRVARGDGMVCRCGNTGCLEALASGPALARALREAGLAAETGDDVLELARHGELQAIRALRQAGRDVGDVLATCVNLLNPSVIVIGGGMAAAGEQLLAGVKEVIYSRSLPLATSSLQVVASAAGDRAALLGASLMVTEHLLSPEGVERELAAAAG